MLNYSSNTIETTACAVKCGANQLIVSNPNLIDHVSFFPGAGEVLD